MKKRYVSWILSRWHFWVIVVLYGVYQSKTTLLTSYEYFFILIKSFIIIFLIFLVVRILLGFIGKIINTK